MRLALFGGSFDPPHVAHQMAALWALETDRVDRVVWVPCWRHAFGKTPASFEDRFTMCRLAAAFLGERAEVSRVEADIGAESRTLHTLTRLRAERPAATWSILMGADLVEESRRWMGYDKIARLADFVVVGRAGCDATGGAPSLPAISSTDVRVRLARGEDASALVPARVLAYIRERGLYGVGP